MARLASQEDVAGAGRRALLASGPLPLLAVMVTAATIARFGGSGGADQGAAAASDFGRVLEQHPI